MSVYHQRSAHLLTVESEIPNTHSLFLYVRGISGVVRSCGCQSQSRPIRAGLNKCGVLCNPPPRCRPPPVVSLSLLAGGGPLLSLSSWRPSIEEVATPSLPLNPPCCHGHPGRERCVCVAVSPRPSLVLGFRSSCWQTDRWTSRETGGLQVDGGDPTHNLSHCYLQRGTCSIKHGGPG